MEVTITITDTQVKEIWVNAFGTSGESMPWWRNIRFLEGSWDTPGVAEVTIQDPLNDDSEIMAIVTPRTLVAAAFEASTTSVDACTGDPINVLGSLDWDSCVSDCVLQTAVLGDVVYG